ncbi:MAG: sulfite exporter TauE/SafE family protein [Bacteroidales bacterium]|nr:sulfite exporter TauE/SafE family protein [Bacteroidales bacterium]MCF8458256.1 sulfite exporter TauE/SafE family protein [Bacteroidales bacterium]
MTQILLLLLIGLAAGFVSGSFGVGGGIILVPALVFFLGFSQHTAQGTSLALMVAPIGLISAWNYYKQDYVNIKVAFIVLVAFFIGSYFGSLMAVKISGKVLHKLFGVLLLAAALKMIFGK